MNERKQNIDRDIRNIALIILVLAVMAFTLIRYYQKASIASRVSEHILGYPTRLGAVGAEVFYDVAPVDIELISPSGLVYDKDSMMLYYINTEAKVITVKVSTQELGEWKIRFPNGFNTKLSYRMLNQASDTLYVDDVTILTSSGPYPILSFCPVFGEPTDAPELEYSITLKKGNDFALLLSSGTIYGNEESHIEMIIPDRCYTGTDYTIRLCVSTSTGQSVPVTKTIFLANRQEDVSENETLDEENGEVTEEE